MAFGWTFARQFSDDLLHEVIFGIPQNIGFSLWRGSRRQSLTIVGVIIANVIRGAGTRGDIVIFILLDNVLGVFAILDMLDVRIALYYGGHDDTHIEINCQIPTPASDFPQTQLDGENVFIVSHTS